MAKLIHREISGDGDTSIRQATHVYSNGDVWQISHDDSGTFAFRITNGYVSRYFPSAEHVRIFGYPDDWKVQGKYEDNGSCKTCGVHYAWHGKPCN